jgi:hypothetical protein
MFLLFALQRSILLTKESVQFILSFGNCGFISRFMLSVSLTPKVITLSGFHCNIIWLLLVEMAWPKVIQLAAPTVFYTIFFKFLHIFFLTVCSANSRQWCDCSCVTWYNGCPTQCQSQCGFRGIGKKSKVMLG